MATLTNLGSTMTYVNIVKGKLVTKAKDGEGIERIKKDGSKTYENIHKDITGVITEVKIVDSDFGQQLSLVFDKEINLKTSLDSKYAISFVTKMCNIDFTTEVTMSVYDFTDEASKRHIGVVLKQNGEKITSNWNNIPALVEKKKAGKTIFDNTDRINYICDYINNFKVIPF